MPNNHKGICVMENIPLSEAIVEGVNRIANHRRKQKGYRISLSIYDTRDNLEALFLLVNEIKKSEKVEAVG